MYCSRDRKECEGKCSCQCAAESQTVIVDGDKITKYCKCPECKTKCECSQVNK